MPIKRGTPTLKSIGNVLTRNDHSMTAEAALWGEDGTLHAKVTVI